MRLRTALGMAALGSAWTSSALAADELPRHRVELTTDRTLPGCADAVELKALMTNWVPVSTIDPTAARAVVVRIRRLPDGGKSVDTTITDENGTEVATYHHDYSPATDCFKVLYWTAFDAATRLRAAAPRKEVAPVPPPPDPPPSPKPSPCPACPPPSKPPPASPAPATRRAFVALGGLVSHGLMPDVAPGLRVAGGLHLPKLSLELDARWMPLWKTRPLAFTEAEIHTFLVTAGACLRRPPLLGCLFSAVGTVGASTLNRGFASHGMRGMFGVGARSAVEFPFAQRFALRVDVEVTLPLVGADLDGIAPTLWETLRPFATGGGSIVYTF